MIGVLPKNGSPLWTMLSGDQSIYRSDGILLVLNPTRYHQILIDQNVTQVRFETVNSTVYACEKSNHALWVTCAYIYILMYACAYKRSTVLVLIMV